MPYHRANEAYPVKSEINVDVRVSYYFGQYDSTSEYRKYQTVPLTLQT